MGYKPNDTAYSSVLIYGNLVIYSISMNYTTAYTPTATQDIVRMMPHVAFPKFNPGLSFVSSTAGFTGFRTRVYNNTSYATDVKQQGMIGVWYSSVTLPANNALVVFGSYITDMNDL